MVYYYIEDRKDMIKKKQANKMTAPHISNRESLKLLGAQLAAAHHKIM